ncbi:MAG: beta-ketoadipate enol-lactone hydrolase [Solirubrobacterales bacterium]|nr:beta-ketoadipate enol-lactone hydrolase [Solirubrobacterales bacterium]
MPTETEALAHLRLASELAGLELDEVVAPTAHHAVLDGLRLHYLDWGRRDRPPLLFLHGGSLTAHTWDLVCLALRHDYYCLAVDQRGHGDSEWSPIVDYGPDAHARDIRGLIEQLGLKKPVLIGQSLGGLHAMTYASHAADQLAGIVLIDVGPGIGAAGAQRIVDFAMNDPGAGALEDFVQRALVFNPRRDPRLLRHSLLHNLRQLPDDTWTWKYDRRRITPEFFASTRRGVEQLRDGIRAITCPVLVVRGAESDMYSDRQAAAFAASLPDGRWTKVAAAGHNVQGDNPRGLVEALTAFLTDIGC